MACGQPAAPPPTPIDLLVTNARVDRRHRRAGARGGRGHRRADASSRCWTPPARPRRPAARARVIDARGRVVAPGFIDMHSHSDMPLVTDGNAQSKIRQGVTTEVIGESGSIAPQKAATAEQPWTDFAGYFGAAREAGHLGEPAVLRRPRHRARAGRRQRQPPADRRRAGEACRTLVSAAMQQGAAGRLDRPHLPAQRLRDARRAGGALHAGGGAGRPLRLAPPPRRQAAARGHRGSDRHRRARQAAGARLPHQGDRPAELRPHEGSGGARRGRSRPGRAGHGRHLSVRGQQHQPHGDAAAVGDGRRADKLVEAAARTAATRARVRRDMEDPNAAWDNRYQSAGTWANVQLASIGRTRGVADRPTRSPNAQVSRACAWRTPRRPPARTRSTSCSTCSSTRAAAWAASTSSCRRTT